MLSRQISDLLNKGLSCQALAVPAPLFKVIHSGASISSTVSFREFQSWRQSRRCSRFRTDYTRTSAIVDSVILFRLSFDRVPLEARQQDVDILSWLDIFPRLKNTAGWVRYRKCCRSLG
jgi:hypothetical protein